MTLDTATSDTARQPAIRSIYRLTGRTIDRRGQAPLLPDYELQDWTTSLPESITLGQVIELYHQHGTHEQFHSGFKTGKGLERLPSGKFGANGLVY